MKGRMDEHMLARRSGAWIRGAVEQYGLPVGDLAATAGVPMERLARLASGAEYPSPDEIDAIAGAVARHVGARWGKADSIRHQFALAAGYYSAGKQTIIPDGHPQARR